jgi:ribosomal-protein-alanine N-acetyltransferase
MPGSGSVWLPDARPKAAPPDRDRQVDPAPAAACRFPRLGRAARESRAFLTPWEPAWAVDHLSRKAFTNRVYWAQRAISQGSAVPLFIHLREGEVLLGAITLDNIRRGPAQAGTLGYWIGESHARHGYMRETIEAVVHYAFRTST